MISVEKKTSTRDKHISKDTVKEQSDTNMPASNAPLIMPQDGSAQRHQPQVFSDEELSEIFQIDFGEIFGSVDEGVKPSKYKGVQLPPPNSAQKSNGNFSNRNVEDQSSTRGNEKSFDFISWSIQSHVLLFSKLNADFQIIYVFVVMLNID